MSTATEIIIGQMERVFTWPEIAAALNYRHPSAKALKSLCVEIVYMRTTNTLARRLSLFALDQVDWEAVSRAAQKTTPAT